MEELLTLALEGLARGKADNDEVPDKSKVEAKIEAKPDDKKEEKDGDELNNDSSASSQQGAPEEHHLEHHPPIDDESHLEQLPWDGGTPNARPTGITAE